MASHLKLTQREPNWLQRFFKRFASSQGGSRLSSHVLHHLDRLATGLSGGRASAAEVLGGMPIIFLTATGVKSGRPRTVPLIATPDGRRIILIASNWGRKGNPAWYYNVMANPEVMVAYRGRRAAYRAREASKSERDACWKKATALYPGYAVYRQKTASREIPVIILEAREDIS
jgi:deazaflavin-dependent oxidoreductase (nitroreductase family)